MPTLTTVVGTVLGVQAQPIGQTKVIFDRIAREVTPVGSSDAMLFAKTISATTDSAGAFSIEMVPGQYTVQFEGPSRTRPARFAAEVPESDVPVQLAQLIQVPLSPDPFAGAFNLALSTGVRTFGSRAECEAAQIPHGVQRWAVLQGGLVLHYRRDPDGTAIASADGVKGSPLGDVYPDHWADNASPGTTDMSDAIEAAMNFAPNVRLTAAVYRVTRTVSVYARDGAGLEGTGWESVIRVDSGDFDVFSFYTGETNQAGVPLACRNVVMRHLQIENAGAERSGGWMITSQERFSDCLFEHIKLVGPHSGIELAAALQVHLSHFYVAGTGRVTTGGPAISITTRPDAGVYDPNSHDQMAKCAGVYLHRCDVAHRNSFLPCFSASLLIESADGVYVSQSHFQGAEWACIIRNSGQDGQVMIGVVDFVGVYFDKSPGGHVRFEGLGQDVLLTLPGATQALRTRFRSVSFTKCQFRAALGPLGSMNFDGITEGSVWRVAVNGSEFRLNNRSGIRDTVHGVRHLKLSDNFFDDNNRDNLSDEGDIVVTDNGHLIRANDHIGGGAAGYGIRIVEGPGGGGIGGTVVAANKLLESAVPLERRIDVVPGVVAELNRIAPGQIAVEIVEQGSGAGGEWVKYSDGRMVVTRLETVTGVGCTTAHGGQFRSGDLIPGISDRNYPEQFLAGTTPHLSVQCGVTEGLPVITMRSDANNVSPHLRWPSAIRVASHVSRTVDVILDLRAEGRWK